MWVRPWLMERAENGACSNIFNHLKLRDFEHFRYYSRMNTESFQHLLELVTPLITKKITSMRVPITPEEKLAVTLRFLATGESLQSLMYQFRISDKTISKFIPEVSVAIYDVLREEYLRFPDWEEKWERISDLIWEKWQFPNCIGAMDGKHIAINYPPSSGSTYWNYKAFYSIVLLASVDASYKFTYNNVGCLGRISDGGVLKASDLYEVIVSGSLSTPPPKPLLIKDPQWNMVGETQQPLPYMIVGDEAFPLQEEIMKPYARKQLDDAKRIFNYRLSRIRIVSDNVFGILS